VTGADFSGVDIDLLADYIGGVLTGTPEESAVAARIADDPAWQAAYESIGDGMSFVSAELGRLDPGPMPADLADRFDTLLTSFIGLNSTAAAPGETPLGRAGADAEAIADAAPMSAARAAPTMPRLALVGGDGAVGDGAHGVRERPSGRRLRWAAPIAVAAGLIAFVGFGLDYLAGRSTGSSASNSGSGVAAARGEVPQARAVPKLASGIDYSHATLGTLPMQPMTAPLASSGEPGRKSAPGLANGVEPALQRLSSPSVLAECLAAIERANAGGTLAVESVDYARFAGAPAVIVRFSAANGHWAWASGADCGTPSAGAATLDKVPVG
jgi:hypothetical protein